MPTFPLLFLNSAALQHLPASIFQTIQQFTVLVLCLTYATECKPDYQNKSDQVPAATNVTLVLVKWFPPAVKVQWQLNQTTVANVKEMQILYNPVRSSVRSMIKVSPEIRQVMLNKLQPNTEYELELVSASKNSMLTNSSSIVNFISPSNESSPISKFAYYTPYSQEELRRKLRITMDEIVILVIVLIVWLTVICIFCSKWSKLRHLEPYHPDYRPSLGSTAQHSPTYSVDSDNLANVGALTTTPVASGGLGDMTDEDDDGLLIGNAAPLQPPIIPCSGMHPTVPLFAHNTSCAHALDNLPVCGGVLITDPASLQMYGGDDGNDIVGDINIPIPNLGTAAAATSKAAIDEPKSNASVGVNKKVQFQSVQHPSASSATSQSYHIAQYAPGAGHPELLQRANSPAFVLPVSMATPHLGDLYCHGTAIAYNANFSTSVDSTASYNSTSCASCTNYALQQGGGGGGSSVQPGDQYASQTGSLDQAAIGGTEPSTDSRSSSLKQQQSVESIWIELPSRFHIRSNSTPSEETTVIYNTPTGSAMNRHSPLAEESAYSGDESAAGRQAEQATGEEAARQTVVVRSKSDELVRSTKKVDRKSRSLELPAAKHEATRKEESGLKSKSSSRQSSGRKASNQKASSLGSSRPHYHSVDQIDHNLPHSQYIQHYHSSAGQLALEQSSADRLDRSSTEQLCRPSKAELLQRKRKRKAPPVELLLRKEHYKSDNLILKSRHKLRELSDEFRASLSHRAHPFRPLHRSFTESETSGCLTRSMASCSSSGELDRTKAVNSRPVQTAGRKRTEERRKRDLVQVLARKSLSTTTDSTTDNETTDRSANTKRPTENYANSTAGDRTSDRTRQQVDSTTITMQSSESSSERSVDEQQQVNRLDSIRERRTPDSSDVSFYRQTNIPAQAAAAAGQQPTSKFKIYQSATMFNLSSAFDEPTELLIGELLAEQRPIRRHQSAEQMLKRIIRNVHDYYRKQFRS